MSKNILKGVDDYYSEKVIRHGNSPQGVDWNSKESQYLRFEQLCKVIQADADFTIIDYGCGYGELYNFLNAGFKNFSYLGFDISQVMIDQAVKAFPEEKNISFQSEEPIVAADYTVASGIFNVKLDLGSSEEWLKYILTTLDKINAISSKGFAFNMLTKYSDKEFMRDYLYYADPLYIFDYCKKTYSKNIALLHDYNLYEFTMIVRK